MNKQSDLKKAIQAVKEVGEQAQNSIRFFGDLLFEIADKDQPKEK